MKATSPCDDGKVSRVHPGPAPANPVSESPRTTRDPHGLAYHVKPPPHKRRRLKLANESECIVDPSRARWVKQWDMLMVVTLMFTAVVTPVEVAFMNEGKHITTLWCINRAVDLTFTLDIFLTFNMAYQVNDERGETFIYSRKRIIRKYLLGWFFIDLISVLPFYLMTFDYEDPYGRTFNASTADEDSASSLSRASALVRVVKLLRMLKLARLFKFSRVFERTLLGDSLTPAHAHAHTCQRTCTLH